MNIFMSGIRSMRGTGRASMLAIVPLLLISCLVCPPGKSGQAAPVMTSVTGMLVAYGSEPHIVWCIRADDGKLYYPAGNLQTVAARIPHETYVWTGLLLPPSGIPVGLVPRHEGMFTTLEWRLPDTNK